MSSFLWRSGTARALRSTAPCGLLLLVLAQLFSPALLASEFQVVIVETADPELPGQLQEHLDVYLVEPSLSPGALRFEIGTDALDRSWLTERGISFEASAERTRALDPTATRGTGLCGQSGPTGIPGCSCYRTVEETYADLEALATANPGLASWQSLSRDSWEKEEGVAPGYDLGVLVIGNTHVSGKSPLVISAAMHARELTTAESATRFAELLVNGYGVDADITWILDNVEVHIVPHQNPDGRKQAETGLSWRKNKNNDFCADGNSRGVDLNRNASFGWGLASGSSGAECAETFRGDAAGSEPETIALEEWMESTFTDWRGPLATDAAPSDAEGVFLSLHSYGGQVLFPWEHDNASNAPNRTGMQTLGRKFGYFTDWLVCDSCIGTASGTTVDQAYGVYGVPAYTFELGSTFFEQCSTFEATIWPLVRDALFYAARTARRPYQWPSGPELLDLVLSAQTVAPGGSLTIDVVADDSLFDSGGQGDEPTQAVASVLMTVDTPPWETAGLPLLAADGSFDAVTEEATGTLDTTGLTLGRHVLWLQAEDAVGALGPPVAAFFQVGEYLFEDDFESADSTAWSQTQP